MTQQATQQGSKKHKNNGSVKPFYIAAWLFPKNCGSAAVLTSALSHQTVWNFLAMPNYAYDLA